MSFPVLSTSTETRATKRAVRVIQRTHAAKVIAQAEVFNCRRQGPKPDDPWSDHAWGAAADFFPRPPTSDDDLQRRAIFHTIIYQSTHRTFANRGRRLATRYVIDHDARLIWFLSDGIRAYTGPLGDHVHGSFGPKPTKTPPCAR